MFLSEIINRTNFILENGVHDKNSLLIVLKGAFEFSFDGKINIAHVNDIVFFPKNIRFSRHVIEPLKCLYIQADSAFDLLNGGLLNTSDIARQNNTVMHLKEAVINANDCLIDHYVNDILISAESGHCFPNKYVNTVIDYINRNYALSLTLDELSKVANMSKQGLILAFKRSVGKTPIEYLNYVRLQNGKELLKNTDNSVGEIAELCGFSNVYYFSNIFKNHIGISPNMFRKNMRL